MKLDRSREPDALAPLPQELEEAVAGLRVFVEPTRGQLELSYQRVQAALGAVSPAPLSPAAVAPPSAVAPPLGMAPPPAVMAGASRALRGRSALWAVAGGVTGMALLAGFAIGRWTTIPPAAPAAQVEAEAGLVPPEAAAPEEQHVPLVASADDAALVADHGAAPDSPSKLVLEHSSDPQHSAVLEHSAISKRGPVAYRSPAQRPAGAGVQLCPARDPLLRAECLLRRQQPERALTALRSAPSQHERERERVLGLTLLARCQLGQEVLSLGKQFFARWPSSPLTWRIRNECPRAEPSSDGSLQRADVSPVRGG